MNQIYQSVKVKLVMALRQLQGCEKIEVLQLHLQIRHQANYLLEVHKV